MLAVAQVDKYYGLDSKEILQNTDGNIKIIKGHKYSIETMQLGIEMVITALTSIRLTKSAILGYSQLMQVIKIVAKQIKKEGLNHGSCSQFLQTVESSHFSSEIAAILTADIGEFLSQQARLIPRFQKGLGTSDVIESVFGKFK